MIHWLMLLSFLPSIFAMLPNAWSTMDDVVFLNFAGMEDSLWIKGVRLGAIVLAGYLVARVLLMLIRKYRKISLSRSDLTALDANTKRVETITAILRNATYVVVILATLFIVLSEVGINIAPLLAGAGIAGVAIGFGAQSLVKDLFYGFFILLENQFGIGDVIQVGDSTGQVEGMTLRTVMLRDLDGRVHIIPNGEVNRVVVYTKGWSRMNLDIEVAYQTDLDKAFDVINMVSQEFYKTHTDALLEVPEILGVEYLGANGIGIKVVAKTLPQKQWDMSRYYRKAIKEAFDKANIEIPFPQRMLHLAQSSGPPAEIKNIIESG